MRRHEQEIKDKEALEAILHEARVLRLGMCRDHEPYVVPVLFGYRDGVIYIHSAPEGTKIEILRHNNRVCFQTELDVEIVKADLACTWKVTYRSLIGWGFASMVDDDAERIHALGIIMEHYSGTTDHEYFGQLLARTAVIKVTIDEMTGKQSGH